MVEIKHEPLADDENQDSITVSEIDETLQDDELCEDPT